MKKIYAIRKIVLSFGALIILICAFFRNALFGKIIIIPFFVCSFAIMGENLFLLLDKIRMSNIFKYIFRISFFVYVFGFLSYMVYYAVINKSYSILAVVAIFLIFTIYFIKKSFANKNSKF